LAAHPPPAGVNILLSPAVPLCEPAELARWMLEARLQARLQLQLHRLVWPGGEDGWTLNLDGPGGAS